MKTADNDVNGHIVRQCRHAVFTDDFRFLLNIADGRLQVRCLRGEMFLYDCIEGTALL